MSIGDFFKIKGRIWSDQIHVVSNFYKSPRFAGIDLAFGFFSLFSNPYRTCRKFLQKKGKKEIYAYGETPLSTLEIIAKTCELKPEDTWMELGSGRGRGCFWIAHFIGCKTIGIEWIPSFIRLGSFLKSCFQMKNLSFHLQNMEEADFRSATVIYLYGTCLETESLDKILQKMEALPTGARVISVSEPLANNHFVLQKEFDVQYPWGETKAYLHFRK